MDYVELELGIFAIGDSFAVEMRFRAGDTATDLVLARNTPIALDIAHLYALQLDKATYGQQLAGMLFCQRSLLDAWHYAKTYSTSFDLTLRVQVRLDPASALLHEICWEALCDPISGEQLGLSERVALVRSLDQHTYAPLRLPPRSALTALAVLASPSDLVEFALGPIDVANEFQRLRRSLGDLEVSCIDGREGRPRATFSAMIEALSDGVHVLYLVCHRTVVNGKAYLWFEEEEGTSVRIAERVVAERIAALRRPPLLVVTAACGSASGADALGPLLARAGIGAVVAMNGNTPAELVRQLMPPFFRALYRDGQIDRALAIARAAVSLDQPWWMPVLWMRVRDGRLWLRNSDLGPGDGYNSQGAYSMAKP